MKYHIILNDIGGGPEAAIDANTINKKATIYYYTYDRMGKLEFEKRKAELDGKELPAIVGDFTDYIE